MSKIEYNKLSEYVKYNMDINPIINEILRITISAKTTYPKYTKWFLEKHVPGIYTGKRDTIVAIYQNEIVGVANIKKGKEKKICTLYFKPNFRKNKLGIELVNIAIKELQCDKPLITMPSTYIPQFKNIIKRYDWEITDCIKDMYIENTQELIFNGNISDQFKELDNEKRLILTYESTKDKNILKLINNPLKLLFIIKRKEKTKKVLSN